MLLVEGAKKRQEDGSCASYGCDAERAFRLATADVMREQAHRSLHTCGGLRDLFAITRHRAATAMAMNQRHAEGLFQLVEAPENARVRTPQLAGRPCDGAFGDDGAKAAQVIPIEIRQRIGQCVHHAV